MGQAEIELVFFIPYVVNFIHKRRCVIHDVWSAVTETGSKWSSIVHLVYRSDSDEIRSI